MAEVAIPRQPFRDMPRRIARLKHKEPSPVPDGQQNSRRVPHIPHNRMQCLPIELLRQADSAPSVTHISFRPNRRSRVSFVARGDTALRGPFFF